MITTLDDDVGDVAKKLNQELRKRGGHFKKSVNKVLRLGLNVRREFASMKPFKVRTLSMGKHSGLA